MKLLTIIIVIITLGVVGFHFYGKSLEMSTIQNEFTNTDIVADENSNDIADFETEVNSRITSKSCSDSDGNTLTLETALSIAEGSICSFQGEVTSSYTCEQKEDGTDVMALTVNLRKSVFDDSEQTCAGYCKIGISDSNITFSKRCN